MSETERLKRPDPERTRPHRSFARVFGPGGALSPRGPEGAADPAGPTAEATDAASGPAPARGPVEEGVALGYRVIDEYIERARGFARSLRPGPTPDPEGRVAGADPFGPGGPFAVEPGLLEATSEQVLGSMLDAASLWLEWLQGMTPDPSTWAAAGPWDPWGAAGASTSGRGAAAAGRVGPERLELRVVSVRPVRVLLELAPGALDAPLRIAPEGGDPRAASAFAAARLHAMPGGERVALGLSVPDGLPAGRYRATVRCGSSGAPLGALELEVSERR